MGPQFTASETMLAFQAPPDAVIAPVTQVRKHARQQHIFPPASPSPQSEDCRPPRRRSVGKGARAGDHVEQDVPLGPEDHQRAQPANAGPAARSARSRTTAIGKSRLAGNAARNCASGCPRSESPRDANRSRCRIGTQTSAASSVKAQYPRKGEQAIPYATSTQSLRRRVRSNRRPSRAAMNQRDGAHDQCIPDHR